MNFLWVVLFTVLGFFVVRMLFLARPGVDVGSAQADLKAGKAVLIDVREPAEWAGGVAQDAALLPLSDLRGPRKQWREFLEKNSGKKLLLYCQSGARSGMAASQLRGEGLSAVNAGTIGDWERAGWPVCAPRELRR